MTSVLRWVHITALCVFLGSIPAHISIGILADHAHGYDAFAVHHQIKLALTKGQTLAGLAIVVVSGLLLWSKQRRILSARWFRVKLALVALIAANGGAILTPLAAEMAVMAQSAAETGILSADFAALKLRESLAGAVNLLAILVAVYLGVARPRLGATVA